MMPLLRSFKKGFAFVFVSSFICQTAYPSVAAMSGGGGGQPVSSGLSSLVDPYTGDFRYSVPLLNVPGPNGENVDITASYHAGIRMDEKASWLGLGWDYNPGEISRQVVGVPDDASDYKVYTRSHPIGLGDSRAAMAYVGAFYSRKISYIPTYTSPTNPSFNPNAVKTKSMDVMMTDRCLDPLQRQLLGGTLPPADPGSSSTSPRARFTKYSFPYRSLAYDNYMVSGPGVSGKIKPYFFDGLSLLTDLAPNENKTYTPGFNRPAQFYMENSSALNVDPHNRAAVSSTTNRVKNGTFIKYYTNAEINNSATLFSNSTQKGFLDYRVVSSGNRRDLTSIEADAIGAFEVTDQSGMTYHYSLPVYSFEDLERSTGIEGYQDYSYKANRYVSSWKLTAVTGPDYQDSNNNGVADNGDAGYWIAYNYSLWNPAFLWSSNQYGLKDDMYSPGFTSQRGGLNSSLGFVNQNYYPNGYEPKKSLITGKTELYYLNHIQTPSHTALFIKSVRKDEQSYDKVLSGTTPAAMLKLDRILLMRNEDLAAFQQTAVPLSGTDLDNHFSYSSASAAQTDRFFMNASKYKAYKTQMDALSLRSVELVQDYSLCKKYPCNINNHYTETTAYYTEGAGTWNPVANTTVGVFYKGGAFASSDDLANSGKLTLNNVRYYDLQAQKLTPSVDFNYGASDANQNPDYSMNKVDLWGFYKSDYADNSNGVTSHYLTPASKDYVSAWSIREIVSPLGGKIQVEYESDEYEKEGFSDDLAFARDPKNAIVTPGTTPSLIFPVQLAPQDASGDFMNYQLMYNDFATFYPLSQQVQTLKNATLVLPIKATCNCAVNGDGESIPYYTVNLVSMIKTISASNNMNPWVFTFDGNPAIKKDVDVDGICASACPGTTQARLMMYDYSYGMGYAMLKFDKLYGGGVRVKNIKTYNPDRNETFTCNYTYEKGYCMNVPKKFMLEAMGGPSHYSLRMNSRMGIEGVGSTVGYKTVTVKQVSQNATSNGSTVLHFANDPIPNPIRVLNPKCSNSPVNPGDIGTYPPQLNCAQTPTVNGDVPFRHYGFTLTLGYDNTDLLSNGRMEYSEVFAEGSTNAIARTEYIYDTSDKWSSMKETYGNLNITEQKQASQLKKACKNAFGAVERQYRSATAEDRYGIYSTYTNYDCFLKKTITTRDGIRMEEIVMERNPATGAATKTKSIDPTQGVFISKISPAYLNTGSYATLGLKSENESYKNQPTLPESSISLRFPYNPGNAQTINEVSHAAASIVVAESKATYTNVYPVRVYNSSTGAYETTSQTKNWWRAYESFSRPLDDITSLGYNTNPWRKQSEGTLYDTESNQIEEKGLNDRKAASKWGYKNRYKLADIANANYNAFTFTSFEDKFLAAPGVYHFGGEITGGQFQDAGSVTGSNPGSGAMKAYPSVLLVKPHTGTYFATVPASTSGPAFNTKQFDVGRTYIAKVWVHKLSNPGAKLVIELNGFTNQSAPVALNTSSDISKTNTENVTVGDWILMSTEIVVPEDFDLTSTHNMKVYVKNTGTSGYAYFDDLAFHPKDAGMTGNVYEERTGLLKAQLDNNNFATFYNYDNAGRVVTTYKEYSGGIKKVSETQYHFSKP